MAYHRSDHRLKMSTMEKKETEKITVDQTEYTTRLSPRYAGRKPYAPPVPGRISSFIPGTVVEILVHEGDTVNKGDDILILDAMKMKNRLKSHIDGRVAAINVKPGDRVAKGVVLVEII
jgi:biotin carboxyl carrier protein